ncbi:Uncharacterized protein FWK35_00033311 [Aphis craccivora]|uniref:Uncharacterized protein n=1 Tax=Aphis craccivora TaxID=307492 RepID=A0A6G0VZW3_APHCR|nr:Uncharacterized protein FWK35_00033311 [Aphis craccivora]
MLQIQTLGVVSCSEMNLVGALRSFFEFPNSFQKRREKPKKNDGKTGIFTQNQFSTKSIFLYGCNSKTNHYKYLIFSPHDVGVSFTVDKIFLTQSKYLKI